MILVERFSIEPSISRRAGQSTISATGLEKPG
jgi:hypothetical protein